MAASNERSIFQEHVYQYSEEFKANISIYKLSPYLYYCKGRYELADLSENEPPKLTYIWPIRMLFPYDSLKAIPDFLEEFGRDVVRPLSEPDWDYFNHCKFQNRLESEETMELRVNFEPYAEIAESAKLLDIILLEEDDFKISMPKTGKTTSTNFSKIDL